MRRGTEVLWTCVPRAVRETDTRTSLYGRSHVPGVQTEARLRAIACPSHQRDFVSCTALHSSPAFSVFLPVLSYLRSSNGIKSIEPPAPNPACCNTDDEHHHRSRECFQVAERRPAPGRAYRPAAHREHEPARRACKAGQADATTDSSGAYSSRLSLVPVVLFGTMAAIQ